MAKALSKGIVRPMGMLMQKLFVKNVNAVALFPFILVKNKDRMDDQQLLNHERIHLRQQLELLIIPFYILYLLEYVLWRLRGRSHDVAYRSISFEKEAYNHQSKKDYLAKRNRFAMWRK